MKQRLILAVSAAVALTMTLAGCAANEQNDNQTPPAQAEQTAAEDQPSAITQPLADQGLSGRLAGGGASSQGAAMDAWRAGFQVTNPDVTIDYDPAGSGTGRENFASGGFAFAGTDAAFSLEDVAAGQFAACAAGSSIVELPVYISPIAIGFNLKDITSLNLDSATIAKIFRGEITTWDDPAIASQNEGVTLPGTAITPVHRADKSGTTGNFTDYLAQTAGEVWVDGSVEEWPAGLSGEAADKTSGVHDTIVATDGAIGYLDASKAGDMGAISIKVGDQYVAHSPQAAAAAVGKSKIQDGRSANDVVVEIDRTLTDPSTYPLILVSYLSTCETYADASVGALVKALVAYIISPEGQAAAASQAGSAPITGNADIEPKVQAAAAVIK
ncbi:MAG: phosphate ABC transporter substrate-binding protein PstS [Bifidobacteriaceae bacterium]|nr:phosphate ABC transporter substrate-binding protein PstS [Bifidobacteriaceae bacterium]